MTVPTVVNLASAEDIRAFLLSDENYAAYALGDLDPPYSQHAVWIGAEDHGALRAIALRYRALEPEVLFLMGAPAGIEALLKYGVKSEQVYYTARPHVTELLGKYYRLLEAHAMHRMRVTPQTFRPITSAASDANPPTPMTMSDAPAIQRLLFESSHIDGRESHDVAFVPSMVRDGYYYGISDRDRLIAAAGTHLVAPRSGVAAVGNVVVHPDFRGRRLGCRVSGAVTEALLKAGFSLVVLNVRRTNMAAMRTYRRLGYDFVAEFIEGLAERLSTPVADTV